MNKGIIDNLELLSKYYKKTGDQWRHAAYQKAVGSIKRLNYEITDAKQARKLPGVGKAIGDKIHEYLQTGKIRKVEEVRASLAKETHKNEKESTIDSFKAIWGVGPAKASELWLAGFRSLKELRKDPSLLTGQQKIGLKYYQELLKPLPRKYIDIMNVAIRYVLNKEFGKNSYQFEVAGSYRRGATSSGDMDVVASSPRFNLKDMVRALEKWGIITDTLSMKGEKFMGIAQCPNGDWWHFRLDIEFVPEDEFGATLLYFVGPKGLNISMRGAAKKQGMILNQHGLFKGNTRIPAFTEKELFEALGMEYIPPTRR